MNNNEKNYLNSIIQAKSMVKKGIIEIDEFRKIEAKLAQKYCIINVKLNILNFVHLTILSL